MNASASQCRYLTSFAGPVLADLDDSHLAIEPMPGTKTAGWLIGHLAVTGDFARRLCGRAPLCPVEWRAKFNPGTQPSSSPTDYPPMAELRDAFRAVYLDLSVAVVDSPDAHWLAKENPYAPARGPFPTAGDFVAYLASTHLAYHLGQLVAWRAAAGLARPQKLDPFAA